MASDAERGFTLLEVLVALIIFALSFGAIAQIFQTALRQSTTASDQLDALALAEREMARIGADLPLSLGETTGLSEIPGAQALAWTRRISLAEPIKGDEMLALYRVVVEISDQAVERPLLALETVKIGPAP